jgi:hypothetical protein
MTPEADRRLPVRLWMLALWSVILRRQGQRGRMLICALVVAFFCLLRKSEFSEAA